VIVVLGSFDGFHKGHQALFEIARDASDRMDMPWGVMTFVPHPQIVLGNGCFVPLFTDSERDFIASFLNIPDFIKVPFCDVKDLNPKDFIEELGSRYKARGIIVGENFKFGKNRSGDVEFLKSYLTKKGWFFAAIPPFKIDGSVVSSSLVRQLVKKGYMQQTEAMLGYPYFIIAPVTEGDHRGRKLGFPTANLLASELKLLPPKGVYATAVLAHDRWWCGALNIGYNPTFERGDEIRIEVHLDQFEGDLYGEMIAVLLLAHIREEKKFESAEGLIAQMKDDVDRVREICRSWFYRREGLLFSLKECWKSYEYRLKVTNYNRISR
jgi:riboflavin kinase/FMN adenylyltransferase